MAREDAYVVEQFKNIVVGHLKDVMVALPALVPQSKEDEALFKEGIKKMGDLIYDLEHCENIREMSRYIDVQRVVQDFDSESIKTLNTRINTSARNSINKLNEMLYSIKGDD